MELVPVLLKFIEGYLQEEEVDEVEEVEDEARGLGAAASGDPMADTAPDTVVDTVEGTGALWEHHRRAARPSLSPLSIS